MRACERWIARGHRVANGNANLCSSRVLRALFGNSLHGGRPGRNERPMTTAVRIRRRPKWKGVVTVRQVMMPAETIMTVPPSPVRRAIRMPLRCRRIWNRRLLLLLLLVLSRGADDCLGWVTTLLSSFYHLVCVLLSRLCLYF